MSEQMKIEVPIGGMDCAECSMHVRNAIAALPGVEQVEVFLASEKALVVVDPQQVGLPAIRGAVERAGYSVPEGGSAASTPEAAQAERFTRAVLIFFGVIFGVVLFVVVVGEWLGLFQALTERVPWFVGLGIVLVGGYPVFRKVVRATLNRQVISHTLMTLGVIAALAVGEWATAAVVVFFMRVGDYVESYTAERARQAVKGLSAMAPQKARVLRRGVELEIPIEQVVVGDLVVVRPGESIPVDGEVASGHAFVDQATITGEAMPVEAGPGARVFAATFVSGGSLQVRVEQVGADTIFGRVIRMVEEAEAHRADVQTIADKFSAYYLPVVVGLAVLTLLIRRDPMATAAVLVVACSCAFALATPIAMLASIGAAARRGLMIKGGKYLELLDQADTLLIDKTGTITLGKPVIIETHVLAFQDMGDGHEQALQKRRLEVLQLAASAERYSEHPLAEALRTAAREAGLVLGEPEKFEAIPGVGVRALVGGVQVAVGNGRMRGAQVQADLQLLQQLAELESSGHSVLVVTLDGFPAALMAAADRLRPEVPVAIQELRRMGVRQIELLTGDHEQAARQLVAELARQMQDGTQIRYRAGLLPEDKIEIVKAYQAQGRRVVMVGDGVNDAPALAQADVGIAMGAAGSDVAIEAAHIALMRADWSLVPQVFEIAQRTMRVVKLNIAFTAVYNLVGLSLAALGYLPPIFAAAAQSLPDLGILANSSRLLRQK